SESPLRADEPPSKRREGLRPVSSFPFRSRMVVLICPARRRPSIGTPRPFRRAGSSSFERQAKAARCLNATLFAGAKRRCVHHNHSFEALSGKENVGRKGARVALLLFA